MLPDLAWLGLGSPYSAGGLAPLGDGILTLDDEGDGALLDAGSGGKFWIESDVDSRRLWLDDDELLFAWWPVPGVGSARIALLGAAESSSVDERGAWPGAPRR